MSMNDRVPTQLLYQIAWVLSVVTILYVFFQIYIPTRFSNPVLGILPAILLLIAELICYGIWQLYIGITEFNKQLRQFSVFLMVYAVVQAIPSSDLLRLVASIVAIVAWSRVYAATGGFSLISVLRDPSASVQQKMIFFAFLRLLVSPVIGAIYLFIRQVNPDVLYQQELTITFSSFFVAYLIRYALQYDQTQ